ncbi:MAG TPA: thioredoxin family protein [Streptosporangiaceae bacterium]|nr:thioredoxin family protein [Streptosporangiaceae bacterium]
MALIAALAVAVVAGLAWRATNGRMRPVAVAAARPTSDPGTPGTMAPDPVRPDTMSAEPISLSAAVPGIAIPGAGAAAAGTPASARAAGRVTAADLGRPLGERATLLQFSSAFCAPCRATRVILAEVAGRAAGVAHVEIDAESHLDLVRSLGVLRTPTVFVLGADGAITARASGQPRKADVLGALAAVLPAESPEGSYSPGRETG